MLKISLYQALRAVARTVDLVNPAVSSHHERTACLFTRIAKAAGFNSRDIRLGFIASILHDVGGLSESARLAPLAYYDIDTNTHARTGAVLLGRVSGLECVSNIVHFHHTTWRNRVEEMPAIAHVVYLADRIDVIMNTLEQVDYLGNAQKVRNAVLKESGDRFCPSSVQAFLEVSESADFWLSLEPGWLSDTLDALSPVKNEWITPSEFHQLAQIIAFVVDTHSRHTVKHSQRVATVAHQLGKMMGYNPVHCMKLETAGLLHDIGKLAIPTSLLDKHGTLTEEERARFQSHSWLTQRILEKIKGAEDIALWAGSHHERTDGKGYPLGRDADKLPESCRIITVADMWCALTESRPYRQAMPKHQALQIIRDTLPSLRDRNILDVLEISAAYE